MEPKLSIIIAVLDSHKVVSRQMLHFMKMNLNPSEIEFIIVDDGSDPPLDEYTYLTWNFRFIETNDSRRWSQPCARNRGAFIARSERLLMTDIDHILSKEAILFCMGSDADKVMFPRQWGVLDEHGGINQSHHVLNKYGLPRGLYEKRGLNAGMHHNTFMMKRNIFYKLDGYDESFCGKYGGDDTDFADRYGMLHRKGEANRHILGPAIYVYPDPNKDVQKVFHSLRR